VRLVQGQMGLVLADCADRSDQAITDPDPDPAAAKRAFDAMVQMQKIDIAAIEAARRG
jgi:predicted 3-demethylubiquinone-9 3-methyltransferase (glyoxalase superfamily)